METLELTIESLAYRGAGVARHNGCVHFVPGTAPGERVVASVARRHKNFNEARLEKILEPSPDRIPRCCPNLPGAVYDHLRYDAEVRAKKQQLADFLNRNNTAPSVETVAIPSPLELHYRNKTTLHAAAANNPRKLGYYLEEKSRVLDIVACPLSRHEINAAIAQFRAGPEFQNLRDHDTVNFRWTAHDGAVCWVNVGPNVIGPPNARHLTEDNGMMVERDGFYQVNPEVAALLTRHVAQWYEDGRETAPRVLDLFCGVGGFAIACALRGAEEARGVEISAGAVACARANARRHNAGARFEALDVEAGVDKIFNKDRLANATVIVDPPRRGLAPNVCNALAASGAPRVIYVSCDPATLCRDLKIFKAAGYTPRRAAMFDMFPRTAHFESAVELVIE